MSIEKNGDFRILYLTHALTSTGAECLASLIEQGYDIVGVVTPVLRYKSASMIGSVATLFRRRGFAFTTVLILRTVMVKGRHLLCRYWPAARRLMRGFHSIDEVGNTYSIRRLHPADVNGPQFMAEAAALRPCLIVIGISDRILKKEFLERFPGRIINLHPGPLPRFRGPDPLYWQLVSGESRGAVSVHYVTEEIDGGNILAQEFFQMDSGETESTLRRKVNEVAPRVLTAAIEKFRQGDPGQKQDIATASYHTHRPKGVAACFPRRSASKQQRLASL